MNEQMKDKKRKIISQVTAALAATEHDNEAQFAAFIIDEKGDVECAAVASVMTKAKMVACLLEDDKKVRELVKLYLDFVFESQLTDDDRVEPVEREER